MKAIRNPYRILAFLYCLFLVSCGGNPAWTREDESEDPVVQLAEQACQCIYDVLDEQEDISASQVVEETDDWALALEGKRPAPEKIEETMKILEMDPTLTSKVDDSECMGEIEEELFSKGITFETLMEAIDRDCKLGLFYN